MKKLYLILIIFLFIFSSVAAAKAPETTYVDKIEKTDNSGKIVYVCPSNSDDAGEDCECSSGYHADNWEVQLKDGMEENGKRCDFISCSGTAHGSWDAKKGECDCTGYLQGDYGHECVISTANCWAEYETCGREVVRNKDDNAGYARRVNNVNKCVPTCADKHGYFSDIVEKYNKQDFKGNPPNNNPNYYYLCVRHPEDPFCQCKNNCFLNNKVPNCQLEKERCESGYAGGLTSVPDDEEEEPEDFEITIELDQEKYILNFDGKDSVLIEGTVLNNSKPLPGLELNIMERDSFNLLTREGSFDKITTTSDSDGRFSFRYNVPFLEERGKFGIGMEPLLDDNRELIDSAFDGRYIDLQIAATYKNPMIYLYQISTAPEIIEFQISNLNKQSTDKSIGANTWAALSFEVYDMDEDTEIIHLFAPYGMLRVLTGGEYVREGSEENLVQSIKLSADYRENPVQFGWHSPKIGLKFDTSFLKSQREAFFGKTKKDNWAGTDTLSAGVGASKEIMQNNLRKVAVGELARAKMMDTFHKGRAISSDSAYQIGGKYVDSIEKARDAKELKMFETPGVKALDIGGRILGGIKYADTLQGGMDGIASDFETIRKQQNDMDAGELISRYTKIGLDTFSMVEGGMGVFGVAGFVPGGFVAAVIAQNALTFAKGTLSWITDTYVEGRSKEFTIKVPIRAQAEDAQGHKSTWETFYVEVKYYAAAPEKVK